MCIACVHIFAKCLLYSKDVSCLRIYNAHDGSAAQILAAADGCFFLQYIFFVHSNLAGQSKRVPLPEGTDPDDWKDWIRLFEMVATIANWNDPPKRRELYTGMTGTAAKAAQDISVEDPPGGPVGGVATLMYVCIIEGQI